jgi:DNA uptake protein ComE-like DNA-binding protein
MTAAILAAMIATPGLSAQATGGLIDVNTATAAQLQGLMHMSPAIAQSVVAHRPYKSIIDLNKLLLDQKLTQPQATEFYRQAFVKINLNTGTKEEFMLIPGVGARMSAEFAEYRPWKTWAQFDKEIGKYVGQQETDRFKQYVFIPGI